MKSIPYKNLIELREMAEQGVAPLGYIAEYKALTDMALRAVSDQTIKYAALLSLAQRRQVFEPTREHYLAVRTAAKLLQVWVMLDLGEAVHDHPITRAALQDQLEQDRRVVEELQHNTPETATEQGERFLQQGKNILDKRLDVLDYWTREATSKAKGFLDRACPRGYTVSDLDALMDLLDEARNEGIRVVETFEREKSYEKLGWR